MVELIRFVGVTIMAFVVVGALRVAFHYMGPQGWQDVRDARLRGDGIGKMLGLRRPDDQGKA